MKTRNLTPNGSTTRFWKRPLAIVLLFLCLPMVGHAMVPGVFSGLVGDGQTGNGTAADMQAFYRGNGILSLTARENGSFTGSLRLEGKSLPVKGKFDPAGVAATLPLKLAGDRTARVAMKYDPTAPAKITGNVTTTGNATITGATLPFQALAGATPEGNLRYTVALPAPEASENTPRGHGYATLVVTTGGTGTLAGKLADGTSFTTTSQITDDGSDAWVLPVYIPLYSSAGLLCGDVRLLQWGPRISVVVSGSLGWMRPASLKATMFPKGFLASLAPLGEKYHPTKNISLLTGTEVPGNFTLTMDPAGAAVAQAGAWPKSNIPALAKSGPAGMRLAFAGATGVFTGAFSRPVGSKSVSTTFAGVVLANPLSLSDTTDPVRAAGFYTTDTESLPVEIRDQAGPIPTPTPTPTPSPAVFALIPAGSFQMGDAADRDSDAPVYAVDVSAFYMEKYEVSKALWDEVRAWGLNNGYTDLPAGEAKAANHPVQTITWYAAVKWCNARSEKDRLTPCYTVSGAVYKTTDNYSVVCNWSASGYRLPTEAEWEKAARGGVSGKRFPWGDTITRWQANYFRNSSYGYDYDLGPEMGYHPTYCYGGYPFTSPVGCFANGNGLYDMAGNVSEMCWDWYGDYGWDNSDPTGPPSGSGRVFRGGCWFTSASACRVAARSNSDPANSHYVIGFRSARR